MCRSFEVCQKGFFKVFGFGDDYYKGAKKGIMTALGF